MSTINGFPLNESSFKDFFHIDPNLRYTGDGTVCIYFSIKSTMTEGIANITNELIIKDFLKDTETYIKSYDFNTFSTLTMGGVIVNWTIVLLVKNLLPLIHSKKMILALMLSKKLHSIEVEHSFMTSFQVQARDDEASFPWCLMYFGK
jgi:hypothetical protein